MNFQDICNWVVLISAVTLAITNIYKFFANPIKAGSKKANDKLNEKIDARIDQKVPELLKKRDEETREKYLAQRMNYLNEIQTEVTNNRFLRPCRSTLARKDLLLPYRRAFPSCYNGA